MSQLVVGTVFGLTIFGFLVYQLITTVTEKLPE